MRDYSSRSPARMPQPKARKERFTAEAQSARRFFISHPPLCVLRVSAVNHPKPLRALRGVEH
jgi:hypothetical protein